MSDRYGRRAILLIVVGFSATMLTFAFIENLTAVYAERFLSGMFAAAVTPGALATIGDLAATEEVRERRLTFVSLARRPALARDLNRLEAEALLKRAEFAKEVQDRRRSHGVARYFNRFRMDRYNVGDVIPFEWAVWCCPIIDHLFASAS
jgi:hypothetical protein